MFVCNHKEFPYDYRQKIDNVTQLQTIDDKKQITEKKSVISACNVDYRLKRSGPKLLNSKFLAKFVSKNQKLMRGLGLHSSLVSASLKVIKFLVGF